MDDKLMKCAEDKDQHKPPEKFPEIIPDNVLECLKNVDEWNFDIFDFMEKTGNKPLKYLSYYLFSRYEIFEKFSIDFKIFENFINRVEDGYKKESNPYHNNVHAADVTQTFNSMLNKTGLIKWLTDLELFACLLAAMIHDYEHTGTSNSFHIMTKSDKAMVYNDRSVQENYHLSASFYILQNENNNILSKLTRDQYYELRGLMIDLVLATDMAFHFQLQKDVRSRMNSKDSKMEKSQALSFILHACDISTPIKNWNLTNKWTTLLVEEFFSQGDRERELNLPISPMCDRFDTMVPESQINFIDFIVKPTFVLCGEMIDYILDQIADRTCGDKSRKILFQRIWQECLADNKKHWQEKALTERHLSIQRQARSF